jgi:hypothetical protein
MNAFYLGSNFSRNQKWRLKGMAQSKLGNKEKEIAITHTPPQRKAWLSEEHLDQRH